MRRIGTHWTIEMTEELKARHAAGESATKIATAMSNGTPMTRNSIIGRAWRLGLSAPKKSPRPRVVPEGKERHHPFGRNPAYAARHRRMASDQKASTIGGSWVSDAKQLTAPSLPEGDFPEPGMKCVGLEELEAHHCRWPMWPHSRRPWDSAAVIFCGAPAEKGLPYCTHHCERAYTPCGPVNGYRIPGQ